MVVHEQKTLPAVFESGFDILPGMSTSIAVLSTQVSRLPHPYTDCVFDELLPKTQYKITPTDCRKLCVSRIIERECGCAPIEIVPYQYENYHYCLTYNSSDEMQVFRQRGCEMNIQDGTAGPSITDEIQDCQSNCHWRCEEVEYSRDTTVSVYPTREVMAFFYTMYLYYNHNKEKQMAWRHFNRPDIKGQNKTPDDYLFRTGQGRTTGNEESVITDAVARWINTSFARVNVYFRDVTIIHRSQVPAYNWNDLLADIGGTLGLWVGVSVMTIFEFVTLCSEMIMLSLNRQNKPLG